MLVNFAFFFIFLGIYTLGDIYYRNLILLIVIWNMYYAIKIRCHIPFGTKIVIFLL